MQVWRLILRLWLPQGRLLNSSDADLPALPFWGAIQLSTPSWRRSWRSSWRGRPACSFPPALLPTWDSSTQFLALKTQYSPMSVTTRLWSMGSGEVEHFWQKTDLRLCRAKRVTYEHLDLRDLEMKLRESRARVKLIVTDGVFSMDAEVNLRFNCLCIL